MVVAKWMKPTVDVSRIGGNANVQAVTRVNARQAFFMYLLREPS
jgi:hypothetical protein